LCHARDTLASSNGHADGLLIWFGAGADPRSSYELFAACRAVWSDAQVRHLAICHAGTPVAAFGRSLALEGRFESVVVVERTGGSMIDRVGSELSRNVDRFCEVRLGPDRVALVPHFSLAQPPPCDTPAITADDVVLVTGGAKGIGAECALRLGV